MADFLDAMAQSSATRTVAAKQAERESALRARALATPTPPALKLHPGGFDLIAEVKRHAPSSGPLAEDADVSPAFAARQADAYVRGGAVAISVLTEPDRFAGTLEDLAAAAKAVPAPVMRKDFLTDPYQVLEARAAGAAGVLLILRIIDDTRLGELLASVAEMQLFVLLEAFDEDDLARAGNALPALASGGTVALVGVNTRNLQSLEVDPHRLADLAKQLPTGVPGVAESGIATPEDATQAVRSGYQLALVGSALMKSPEPTRLAAAMIEAGRAEARNECASA
jgi:indole-3-glycerol phosphate synthase